MADSDVSVKITENWRENGEERIYWHQIETDWKIIARFTKVKLMLAFVMAYSKSIWQCMVYDIGTSFFNSVLRQKIALSLISEQEINFVFWTNRFGGVSHAIENWDWETYCKWLFDCFPNGKDLFLYLEAAFHILKCIDIYAKT